MPEQFYCKKCNYSCNKKSLWTQHLRTNKHNRKKKELKYVCEMCDAEYSTRQGLHKHKRACKEDMTALVKTLVNENKKLTDTIKSMEPKVVNNNTFNINVFLNEDCSDAINFTEFIKSLQVNLKELGKTPPPGYVEGISKVFINRLKELEVTKRPIHCSDVKRETLYIKDNDEWSRENTKKKMKQAIQDVNKRQFSQLLQCDSSNENFLDMVKSTTGSTSEEEMGKFENQIISNVAKEVVVDKIEN